MVALAWGERFGQQSTTKAKSGSATNVPDSVPPVAKTSVFSDDSAIGCGPSPTAIDDGVSFSPLALLPPVHKTRKNVPRTLFRTSRP